MGGRRIAGRERMDEQMDGMVTPHPPTEVDEPGQPRLWDLALVFLKVGATGFGGAMPMLAMIQHEVVASRRWVSQDEFDEAVMIGQILPGPIAVDAVTHISYRLRGWPGAVVSWVSFILPSFLLMLALTILYLNYGQMPQVTGALKGLGAGVVAVIAAAAYRMGRPAFREPRSLIILVAAMVGLLVFHANVILLVVLAGVAGIVLYRGQNVPLPGGGRPLGRRVGR